jgi:hypothetical protein
MPANEQREVLWREMRRGDTRYAEELLAQVVESDAEVDCHMLVTAIELLGQSTSSTLRPRLLEWIAHSGATSDGLELLAATGLAFHDGRIDEVVRMSEEGGSQGQGSVVGDAAAYRDWYVLRACKRLGDPERWKEAAHAALAQHGTNPHVLAQALVGHTAFRSLRDPDGTCIALFRGLREPSVTRFFMHSGLPAVASAISAFLHHSDDQREHAQRDLDRYLGLSAGCHEDVLASLEALESIDSGYAKRQAQVLPRTSSRFLVAAYRYGALDKPLPQLDEQLASGNMNLILLEYSLAKATRALANSDWHAARTGLTAVLDHVPGHPAALEHLFRLSLATSELDAARDASKRLLSSSWNRLNVFTKLASVLIQRGHARLAGELASHFAAITSAEESSRPSALEWVVHVFAAAGMHEKLAAHVESSITVLSDADAKGMFRRPALQKVFQELPDMTQLSSRTLYLALPALLSSADTAGARGALAVLGSRNGGEAGECDRGKVAAWSESLDAFTHVGSQADLMTHGTALLDAVAGLEVDDVLALVELPVRRLLEAAEYEQISRIVEALAEHFQHERLILWGARVFWQSLKDTNGALRLLSRYSWLTSADEACVALQCRLFEESGRTEEWLQTAKDACQRFSSGGDMRIELGLARLASGQREAGVGDLVHGLRESTTNLRGLAALSRLAKAYGRGDEFVDILDRASSLAPDSDNIRSIRREFLSSLAGFEERALPLMRAHAESLRLKTLPDEEANRLKAYFGRISSVRRRFTHVAGDDLLSADRCSRELDASVTTALQQLPGDLRARVIDAVSTDGSSTGDTETAGPTDEGDAARMGVLVVVEDRGLPKTDSGQVREAIRSRLSSQLPDLAIRVQGVVGIWDDLRRGDASDLVLLVRRPTLLASEFGAVLRMLAGLRDRVIDKFESYIVCFVLAGSYARGTHQQASDVDAWVVVDDSDVNRMSHNELSAKVSAMIHEYATEAGLLSGLTRQLHVQVYMLSTYWQWLSQGDAITLSMIADGVPLMDRGLFGAWSRLQKRGELTATTEHLRYQSHHLSQLMTEALASLAKTARSLVEPIKYCAIKPLERILQIVSVPVGDYRQVVHAVEHEFVEKRGLLTPHDIEVAATAVDFMKAVEAGVPPDISEAIRHFEEVRLLAQKVNGLAPRLMLERDSLIVNQVVIAIDQLGAGLPGLEEVGTLSGARAELASFRADAVEALESSDDILRPMWVSALARRAPRVHLLVQRTEP